MENERIEQKLKKYFQVEASNAEPPIDWEKNIARVCEGLPQHGASASFRERYFSWLRRPALRIGSAALASVTAVVLALLAIFQPWVPAAGLQSVLAVEKVIAATEEVESYRVDLYTSATMDAEGSIQPLNGELRFEVVAPDCVRLKMTVTVLQGSNGDATPVETTGEFLFIGNKEYYVPRLNMIMPDLDTLFSPAGPAEVLSREQALEILDAMTDVQQLPDETIDGVNCWRYTGISDGLPTNLWIGKDDYLIRQISQQQPQHIGTDYRFIRRYYDFNAPIVIEAPLTVSGELLPGWRVWDVTSDTKISIDDILGTPRGWMMGSDVTVDGISYPGYLEDGNPVLLSDYEVAVYTARWLSLREFGDVEPKVEFFDGGVRAVGTSNFNTCYHVSIALKNGQVNMGFLCRDAWEAVMASDRDELLPVLKELWAGLKQAEDPQAYFDSLPSETQDAMRASLRPSLDEPSLYMLTFD
jgi:hypothetical protein